VLQSHIYSFSFLWKLRMFVSPEQHLRGAGRQTESLKRADVQDSAGLPRRRHGPPLLSRTTAYKREVVEQQRIFGLSRRWPCHIVLNLTMNQQNGPPSRGCGILGRQQHLIFGPRMPINGEAPSAVGTACRVGSSGIATSDNLGCGRLSGS
jgi:hypothetical protein